MTMCRCGRTMVEITLETPAAPVVLRSCGACDRTEWQVAQESVDRDRALAQLATTGRA